MGVPALFRWLSKKYPKIILPVEEEEETKMKAEDGEEVVVPLNMALPNPNGVEFDNLYLDMNGIVHPCTHPEGKPAPETEQEMMLEIFSYTERVVNMIRPRKLLFMAIDGVAPRAKMNQQRSRRFRSSQEAKDKEDARKESVLLWKSMGKEITDEASDKPPWDSNAITPGTPFMDLLALSLRYWVVQKMNSDPGWKNIQVLISDATVPGEGEHKIMDFIRRQRSNVGHDPNTRHVIYGLDADLIMLALATHEPHFRVLREDVFSQDKSSACRICGQEGHYAAECTGTKSEIQKPPPSEKKPFIFLDVSTLREYLEVELDVPTTSFPFSLEQAIDDWVLLIFFVGNDFLPHLPSLEIREGAIDTLLKIWKQELPRMDGYLTNHGNLELTRAQIILEGLARREDEIFRRRRENDERQEQNAKRRKLEKEASQMRFSAGPSQTMALTVPPTAPSIIPGPAPPTLHHSLPKRPNDFAANADSIGLGAQPTTESIANMSTAANALAGSNRDVVANRRAIRLANMSAAEVLKAELAGLSPVKPSANSSAKAVPATPQPEEMNVVQKEEVPEPNLDVPPGLSTYPSISDLSTAEYPPSTPPPPPPELNSSSFKTEVDVGGSAAFDSIMAPPESESTPVVDEAVDDILAGAKRKFEEGPGEADAVGEEDVGSAEEDEDLDATAANLALKVNADGTVDQEDTVKLWEPGYKERYYRQKFGVELTDTEFRKNLTKSYVEGMAWVLQYYYQGAPSWQWYYPYHFAPFAADFEEVDKMDIQFKLGQPFKPFEQLMGVFPAASRKHIPEAFHHLMTDEDSPIIDFYPPTFEIDMNGKKMAWQGVALLPFIDEKRLLDAMATPYTKISKEEEERNKPGNNVVFAATDHPLYPFYEALYGKRKSSEPVPIDVKLSHGMSGSVVPNPDCIPGSTYYCPLTEQNLPDIRNDQSLSVIYFFPPQLTPHCSVLLPGCHRPPRTLGPADLEVTRRGGRGGGRGGWDSGGGRGNGMDRNRNDPFHGRPNEFHTTRGGYGGYGNERGGPNRGRGDFYGGVYGGGGNSNRGGQSYQNSYSNQTYPSRGQPPSNYGNSGQGRGGYGGGDSYPRGNYGGGSNSYNGNPRGGFNSAQSGYDSYRNGTTSNVSGYGGYGGYGGQGASEGGARGGGRGGNYGGGYGGYGGYGASNPQPSPNYATRGSNTHNSARGGRGRGW
ncbi:hypothetical protein CPB83DRAFT_843214 [Crepidotus variabilis]|uniref:5'-3' exoribonuclease n=1 Tax=Crepidotus variabilis TaxID=179855 RepID=A0A9P6ETX1_9AGAR|nr:hypothetical protein CPB83DRAFT_843214 [Crepidotus variabilis]